MEGMGEALIAITANKERAEEIIGMALDADRGRTISGLAAFVVAALDGVVIDPETY
jgi:hypothetical protein